MWLDFLRGLSESAPDALSWLLDCYGFVWFLSIVEPLTVHHLVFFVVHGYWP